MREQVPLEVASSVEGIVALSAFESFLTRMRENMRLGIAILFVERILP